MVGKSEKMTMGFTGKKRKKKEKTTT